MNVYLLSWFLNARLSGTRDDDVWPGVGKLPNLHEYPDFFLRVPSLELLKTVYCISLDANGLDLLEFIVIKHVYPTIGAT